MKTAYLKNTLLIAALLVATSCKKYLEVVPNNALPTESAITDAGTARAAIIGAYDRVQGYYASSYPTLGTITTDNVIFNGTLSEYLQLDQNAVPTDNVITVSAYQSIYRAINSANSVIAYVPGVQDAQLTNTERNKILGEAYFIRALGYFDLARGWGGVQLQLKPTTDLSVLKGIKRSTLDQTYDQVQADLVQAEQLLPEDATTRNRAQKSAARALRARLHLYRKQWADAENYATQVISNTKYALVKPYKSFFTAPFQTSESVFELAYSVNDRNTYWNLWYPSSAGGQYTLKPSDALVAKLNNPAIGGSRNTLIAGTGSSVYGVLYNTTSTSVDPSYLIRIAELYLIRAEARAQQGKLADAAADLNIIRARADVAATTATTQAQLMQAIEDENGVEFAFEAHRWFDLTRTERAGAVLGLTNRNYWLFPIPYSDILSDPDVTQNPGY
ncbi:RagB/SusD family nutrient uptake outer membrane protein [Mucilaginibacter daejeonensis]|uniref:RagB/SusD family nutrient uptake outer membrane protein n=1 Tax=Mucilaginibacter daejeonensis TaxID=398049 RepID=UPI001D17A840|nr:RagB/SusD family nutrient uptake outer membrane protein [Mucilaginibacter daejeonensis]UEG52139.1 RagB/SusD family nutrient uptake outer membrane protein [Mucilaginibacter daejeonensis]